MNQILRMVAVQMRALVISGYSTILMDQIMKNLWKARRQAENRLRYRSRHGYEEDGHSGTYLRH